MARVVSVQRLPGLTGALVDNRAVRADGTGNVQSSAVVIGDVVDLGGGQTYTPIYSTEDMIRLGPGETGPAVYAGDSSGVPTVSILGEAGYARINVTGGVGTRAIDAIAATVSIVPSTSMTLGTGSGGWTIGATPYTAAEVASTFALGKLDAAARTSLGVDASPIRAKCTAQTVIQTVALADITGMAVSLVAGSSYAITAVIALNSPAADDIAFCMVNGTGTAVGNCSTQLGSTTASLGYAVETGLMSTTGALQYARMFAYVYCSVSGTIKIQARKSVDTAGTDTTIETAGTHMSATLIGSN